MLFGMQSLGITPEAVTANIVPGLNTFMPQGNLATLIAGEVDQSPILVSTNSLVHPIMVTSGNYRLPLLSGVQPEVRRFPLLQHLPSHPFSTLDTFPPVT